MGTPLTEEKFNEFLKVFESRMSGLETRMSGLETRMSGLETKVDQIKGFQDHEAKAIEYELRMILEAYLKRKFPLNNIQHFPMKTIKDIHDTEITELDAAFLIAPITPKYNYSRLSRDDMYMMLEKKYIPTDGCKFVLAEAKHHLTTKKIKIKLEQFYKICQTFVIANKLLTHPETDLSMYSPEFIKNVRSSNFLGNIETSYLYFGAAYWDGGLLDRFQQMINEYNKLTSDFESANDERKISIYRKLCRLESNWYVVNNPILPDADILKLAKIETIYNFVHFILPSGQRFHVPVDPEPEGYLHHVGGGGILPTKRAATRKIR